MANLTIAQTDAELFTEVLSTPNHAFQSKLNDLIKKQAKKMSHSTGAVKDYSQEEWLEGVRIKDMCDVLFWRGNVSAKQVAWMVRYAIKHNVQL